MFYKRDFKSNLILFLIFISITFLYLNKVSITTDRKYYEVIYIQESQTKGKLNEILSVKSKPTCGRFPMLIDLNVSDTNWQVTRTSNGTFYLYKAYFDDREGLKNNSVVRILALVNKIEINLKAYCQVWFDGMNEPIPVRVEEYLLTWLIPWGNNSEGLNPFLINCPNPLSNISLVPKFVSFVEHECDNANNILEISNKRLKNGHKDKFLVSVKSLDFQNDISLLLIEWLEILKIFGANKVEMFVSNAHPNVIRTLQLYQEENFVTIKFITFPHEHQKLAKEFWIQTFQYDLIAYHDSFYENLYLYEYIIPLDIDEIITPLHPQDRTWRDLMIRTLEKSKAVNKIFNSFPAQNMFFILKSDHKNETIPEIPKKLRFLSNIYRNANFTPSNGRAKTFMKMDRIIILHNHFPLKCFVYCEWFPIQPEFGYSAHYRDSCPEDECKESIKNPVKDTRLWRYKNEILTNLNLTIKKLKNFRNDFESLEMNLTLD